jgi:hypothetical protein
VRVSLQTPEAPNQQAASQTEVEESEWQHYRFENFCSSYAPKQVAPHEDDRDLQAAIEASKAAEAEAQAQEAFLAALTGRSAHNHQSGGSSSPEQAGGSSTSVQPNAHCSWFPPVATTIMEDASHNGYAEGHGIRISALEQSKALDETYSDVMAFLLNPEEPL